MIVETLLVESEEFGMFVVALYGYLCCGDDTEIRVGRLVLEGIEVSEEFKARGEFRSEILTF